MSHDDTDHTDERSRAPGDAGADDAFEHTLRASLREHYPGPGFPEAEIEDRILQSVADRERSGRVRVRDIPWWKGSTVQPVLVAAASVLLFIGGAEYGRRTMTPPAAVTPVAVEDGGGVPGGPGGVAAGANQPASLPLSIQASGTRYVASLARFAGQAESLSPEQRRIAREVALTALYGAALELLGEWEDEESLRQTVQLLSATKAELYEPGGGQRF